MIVHALSQEQPHKRVQHHILTQNLKTLNLLVLLLKYWVLLTSALGALFKNFKRKNYFIKKSNILISDTFITHIFIISYYLKVLTSAQRAPVNISLKYFTQ